MSRIMDEKMHKCFLFPESWEKLNYFKNTSVSEKLFCVSLLPHIELIKPNPVLSSLIDPYGPHRALSLLSLSQHYWPSWSSLIEPYQTLLSVMDPYGALLLSRLIQHHWFYWPLVLTHQSFHQPLSSLINPYRMDWPYQVGETFLRSFLPHIELIKPYPVLSSLIDPYVPYRTLSQQIFA
jgi:hypothetical protein